MFRLTMLGKLGLVVVIALVLVGGNLVAQWIDSNGENSLPDERSVGLASTVLNEEAKLLASDGEVFDLFGISVAVSGDTAVVGASLANSGIGEAYVFVRGGTCGSAWCEEAKLLPMDGENHDLFGDSVAVSGDTAVVGATFGNRDTGAAYVFVRGGTCGSPWCEEAKLLASDGAEVDFFGFPVAISGDTAVVGAGGDDDKGSRSGAAYVFRRGGTCGSAWCEEVKLLASDGADDDFLGFSVAVSGDTAIVGAEGQDDNGNDSGAAYVFHRGGTCGSAWCEEAKLLASDGAELDIFGFSVAVRGDTAVVGAGGDDYKGSRSGAAYVFHRGGTCGSAWCEEAKLLASDGAANDSFGYSVAVSGDTAIVGARNDDDNGRDSGSAYAFVRGGTCGSAWCEEAKLLASDGTANDSFGAAVAVCGQVAVVGAFIDDGVRGSAYVFRVPAGDCDPCFQWKNHGEYVRCVSNAVSALVECGAMTQMEGGALISTAARSDVGKESFIPPECTP